MDVPNLELESQSSLLFLNIKKDQSPWQAWSVMRGWGSWGSIKCKVMCHRKGLHPRTKPKLKLHHETIPISSEYTILKIRIYTLASISIILPFFVFMHCWGRRLSRIIMINHGSAPCAIISAASSLAIGSNWIRANAIKQALRLCLSLLMLCKTSLRTLLFPTSAY